MNPSPKISPVMVSTDIDSSKKSGWIAEANGETSVSKERIEGTLSDRNEKSAVILREDGKGVTLHWNALPFKEWDRAVLYFGVGEKYVSRDSYQGAYHSSDKIWFVTEEECRAITGRQRRSVIDTDRKEYKDWEKGLILNWATNSLFLR